MDIGRYRFGPSTSAAFVEIENATMVAVHRMHKSWRMGSHQVMLKGTETSGVPSGTIQTFIESRSVMAALGGDCRCRTKKLLAPW